MITPGIPSQGQTDRGHPPHWVAPAVLALAFFLIHILAPWALSLLSTRYGWTDGRPGPWNLLALIVVIPGLASTAWMAFVHYRASPDTFVQFQQSRQLITPGPYSFSRNPMYIVELAFWLGWALFYGSVPVFMAFLLLIVLFNFVIVPREERDLEARFGEDYRQYRHRVPRWIGNTRR